jgi:adenosine deaminase CECR1
MDAIVDFDFLFDTLLTTPGMHIHSMHAISTPEELEVSLLPY